MGEGVAVDSARVQIISKISLTFKNFLEPGKTMALRLTRRDQAEE